ncbi:MAG: hypothetical protein OXH96_07325 [Spirochaetaceae bacterium]|nr:hypothetical protein [Spirochaetaceae bacterium]MDE0446471.1 hypothetical protein [Spirochaetaceae bacterium]
MTAEHESIAGDSPRRRQHPLLGDAAAVDLDTSGLVKVSRK